MCVEYANRFEIQLDNIHMQRDLIKIMYTIQASFYSYFTTHDNK